MTQTRKTPGVYITELDAFGNSVVPVPTAVPVFIGYTASNIYIGKDVSNQPIKISSFNEFTTIFGGKPTVKFKVINNNLPLSLENTTIALASVNYRLWSSMKLFYANGGNECYIISIGTYEENGALYLSDINPFIEAIDLLGKETEATMLVIPDLVEFNSEGDNSEFAIRYANCYALQQAMLKHCGMTKDKIAIFDIPGGYSEQIIGKKSYEYFRETWKEEDANYLSYGVAYYPWLNTTIYELKEVGQRNFTADSFDLIKQLLDLDKILIGNTESKDYINVLTGKPSAITQDQAHVALYNLSGTYRTLVGKIIDQLNLMPPSAAMAGVYTSVDNNEGVWVAPANLSLQSVVSPSFHITSELQEDLNISIDGKSICAIRAFSGRGTLVWGARTLDGNSNDWRYVNVRRTLIYIEQSVKNATNAYVFAPNVSSTWVDVSAMISNFLTGLWNQGGLVGAKASDAFSVSVGLGVTMTSEDILNGNMRVAVKVSISHPAEFIEISFYQPMQA